MRQCIFVVGTREQVPELGPILAQTKDSGLKYSVVATGEQAVDEALASAGVRMSTAMPALPEPRSQVAKWLYWLPVTAYRIYNYVHGVKMWTTKSPLIVIHGNGLSARLASRAGRWGGGQLVHLQHTHASAPGQHRIIKKARFAFCDAREANALSSRYPGCTVVGLDFDHSTSAQAVVESLLRWTGGRSSPD